VALVSKPSWFREKAESGKRAKQKCRVQPRGVVKTKPRNEAEKEKMVEVKNPESYNRV
jgi:hypothetical protein